jgi:hypothetical protein
MSPTTASENLPAHAPYPAEWRSSAPLEHTPHDDPAAIDRHADRHVDRYVAATFDRYQRALVAQLPTFAEPRVADPDRALERLRFLVETLAGFGIGAAIGAVARAARRGFGDEVRAGVGRVLGRVMLDGAPRTATELLAPVPFLRDPARPLIDALGSLLLVRLCGAIPEVRTHVALVHAEIAREAPTRLRAFAGVLDRLAADDASALAFEGQLAAGWQFYAAAVSGREPPADATGTWTAWTRRLSGRAPAAQPTRDQVIAEGFLMRIA